MNYTERITKFKATLTDKADLAFFPISADLQYLAGVSRPMPTFGTIKHPGGWVEGLWIAPGAEPVMVLTRMTVEFNNPGGVENVIVLGDHEEPGALLKKIISEFKLDQINTIAFGERTEAETFMQFQAFAQAVTFTSASDLLAPQRMCKSDEEIAAMRKAGEITENAFTAVLKAMRHGMTELDLILETDHQLRAHGSFGPSFNTTLYVVGPEHELIFNQPEQTWNRKLTPPVSILFDFGAICEGYCYDFGRTVSFGAPAPDLLKAHQLVMASQAAGITAMRAGQVTTEAVDAAARAVIEDAGMGETFMHRLGHGIGLDVHEPPFLTQGDQTALQNGMLFTVEPSVLVPFAGSARVEDVVMVSDEGGVPLTKGFQSLIVIE